MCVVFFFQAEDGIRDLVRSRGLGDVYKRQPINDADDNSFFSLTGDGRFAYFSALMKGGFGDRDIWKIEYNDTTDHPFQTLITGNVSSTTAVSYTHLRAHETVLDLVCRLLLEKKKQNYTTSIITTTTHKTSTRNHYSN